VYFSKFLLRENDLVASHLISVRNICASPRLLRQQINEHLGEIEIKINIMYYIAGRLIPAKKLLKEPIIQPTLFNSI
jgi:hypothetical protein